MAHVAVKCYSIKWERDEPTKQATTVYYSVYRGIHEYICLPGKLVANEQMCGKSV
jgi:hypothetical protein